MTIGKNDQKEVVDSDVTSATFSVTLPKGPAMLQTWLTRADGKQHGAYYTRVHYVGSE